MSENTLQLAIDRENMLSLIAPEVMAKLEIPLFEEKITKENLEFFKSLKSYELEPFPGQVPVIIATIKGLREKDSVVQIGDPGVGKTPMSAFEAAELNRLSEKKEGLKMLFLTEGKLIEEMQKEYKKFLGKKVITLVLRHRAKYEVNTDGSPKRYGPCKTTKTGKKKLHKKKIKGKWEYFDKGDLVPQALKENEILVEDIKNLHCDKDTFFAIFLSKDEGKQENVFDSKYKWGDKCPRCSTFLFPRTFEIKNKLNVEGKKYSNLTLNPLTGEKEWKLEKFPKGSPKECQNCKENLYSIQNTAMTQFKKPIFKNRFIKNESELVLRKGREKRKSSLGENLRRELKKIKSYHLIDLLVVDEVHNFQTENSLQTNLYFDLGRIAQKKLIMTGTLSNGNASSIFYILQGVLAKELKKEGFHYENLGGFVDSFGSMSRSTVKNNESGRITTRIPTELPSINDGISAILMPYTVWVTMDDLNLDMPAYSEIPHQVDMSNETIKHLTEYINSVIDALKEFNPKGIKSFLRNLERMQNNPCFPYSYKLKGLQKDEDGIETPIEIDFDYEPLPEDEIFEKEAKLISLIRESLSRGRKNLVYSIHNPSAGVDERLEKVLREAFPEEIIARMPSTINSASIKPWFDSNTDASIAIGSPNKVSTGLNLPQYSSIYFYETGNKIRIVDQSKKRSYRASGADSSVPVEVNFLAYTGPQAKTLKSIGDKAKSANKVSTSKVLVSELSGQFDEEKEVTKIKNETADLLAADVLSLDFSELSKEAGRSRAWTKFEEAYINTVSNSNNDILNLIEEEIIVHVAPINDCDQQAAIIETSIETEPEVVIPAEAPKELKLVQLQFDF